MRIAIGCDHAAYAEKEEIKAYLESKGIEVVDKGCYSPDRANYPQYAAAVARAVTQGEVERGVLICGTGIGMSIVANKFKGIRATLCHNAFTAQACREHNDSNVLCMGARVLDIAQMKEIVDIWLTTEFGGGRHAERLAMITELENELQK